MFRQAKSALFWYYLYKFRKKVLIIAFLLIVAIFANAIYNDIVQYLTLKDKLQYLELALSAKWIVIIFNLLMSVYILLTLFSNKQDEKKEKIKVKEKVDEIITIEKEEPVNEKFTQREEKFLRKELKSQADLLVER